VKNARQNFITGINDFMRIPNWYKGIRKIATFHKSPMKMKRKSANEVDSPTKAFNPIFEQSPI